MTRTLALIRRIRQQMLRDRRTLALLFVAPLFVLTLMYYLFNGNDDPSRLGVSQVPATVVQALEEADLTVIAYDHIDEELLTREKLDGALQLTDGQLSLALTNNDPTKAKALQMKVAQTLAAASQGAQSAEQPGGRNMTTTYLYGTADTNFFDVLSPILVGFFVFFFVFLISGIGLLRERMTGTLERLMSTPIRRSEVITGYLAGYGIFAVIQTIIVVFYAITVLDITLAGSIWNVLLVNLLLALVALSLGILLSTFASSEFQMVQFIPIVIIPQVFFAGIFPFDAMAGWMQVLARIMPLYYGADALKGVMYKGWGFGDIAVDVLVLLLFAAVFIALNTFALRKYRKL
ncbi:ABC-2 type transport system permease protein [Paenibacillus phyllosphaerae]|uniref:ABC-2 type transport system permease protein n=1 Tax=Paenibacillus phyllosphaerae TaxID=274593 RepID=A0A7W5AYM7_9BACL|nr:ABC transporter permease [Paenibacillus phyllosphaerae]MBB3111195.1 ABC-2 type transport system permease protein [Paenibacillus phyllosphaerae]